MLDWPDWGQCWGSRQAASVYKTVSSIFHPGALPNPKSCRTVTLTCTTHTSNRLHFIKWPPHHHHHHCGQLLASICGDFIVPCRVDQMQCVWWSGALWWARVSAWDQHWWAACMCDNSRSCRRGSRTYVRIYACQLLEREKLKRQSKK